MKDLTPISVSRNAMEDANGAAQLMMTNPIRTFNELLQTFGKEFSGDVLHKKVIEKAKAMLGQPIVTPRTISEAGACFGAGTLVHTKDGLKPIEQIQVGDWVLSQPEEKGEQAYKRVVNTFSFEDKSVVRIRYSVMRDGEWQNDGLIVTGNHPFWLAGVDKPTFPDTFTWDDLQLGWTRADELFSGAFIELTTGELARVLSSSVNRLWKTKQPTIALDSKIDNENGFLVSINDAVNISDWTQSGFSQYLHDDDTFIYREDDPVSAEKWLYRCKVYNFEVEDFHTYYVGNLGAWVHNTNCYSTTVDYLKKNGVLPSIDGQAFFRSKTRIKN
jgi:Pretoxin HINT domain